MCASQTSRGSNALLADSNEQVRTAASSYAVLGSLDVSFVYGLDGHVATDCGNAIAIPCGRTDVVYYQRRRLFMKVGPQSLSLASTWFTVLVKPAVAVCSGLFSI